MCVFFLERLFSFFAELVFVFLVGFFCLMNGVCVCVCVCVVVVIVNCSKSTQNSPQTQFSHHNIALFL